MPRVLVLDCCALVHAKELRALPHAPLVLLARLAESCGYCYLTTKRVYGEQLNSSLSQFLSDLPRGVLSQENVSRDNVKALQRHLRGLRREPGDNDKALIALAVARGAALLTHDVAAAALAMAAGVEVLDLIDLAMHACWGGVVEVSELHAAWGALRGYAWPWPDYPWEGDVTATFHARYGG